MLECVELTEAQLTARLDAGYTLVSGPHETEAECLAECGGGTGTGTGTGTGDVERVSVPCVDDPVPEVLYATVEVDGCPDAGGTYPMVAQPNPIVDFIWSSVTGPTFGDCCPQHPDSEWVLTFGCESPSGDLGFDMEMLSGSASGTLTVHSFDPFHATWTGTYSCADGLGGFNTGDVTVELTETPP
jgi:hypothetical protein